MDAPAPEDVIPDCDLFIEIKSLDLGLLWTIAPLRSPQGRTFLDSPNIKTLEL